MINVVEIAHSKNADVELCTTFKFKFFKKVYKVYCFNNMDKSIIFIQLFLNETMIGDTIVYKLSDKGHKCLIDVLDYNAGISDEIKFYEDELLEQINNEIMKIQFNALNI